MQHPTLLILTDNTKYNDHIKTMALDLLSTPNYQNHPDYFELNDDATTSIGIEAVKNFEKQIKLRPFQSKNKLYVIKNSNQLTVQAQNALLKTLEEPPIFTQIVLFAPSKSNLLSTILSRCLIHELNERVEVDERLYTQASEFLKMNSAQRFLFIEELSRLNPIVTRNQNIIGLLNAIAEVLKENTLSKNPTQANLNIYKDKLKLIESTSKFLRANANFKLTLENLAIRL